MKRIMIPKETSLRSKTADSAFSPFINSVPKHAIEITTLATINDL